LSRKICEPSRFILSHGTEVILPFPSCFLYNPKFPGRPLAFTLVYGCAYSTLKIGAICSSETSVDFQQTTGVTSQKIVIFKIVMFVDQN
jgi:hypothetical protein